MLGLDFMAMVSPWELSGCPPWQHLTGEFLDAKLIWLESRVWSLRVLFFKRIDQIGFLLLSPFILFTLHVVYMYIKMFNLIMTHDTFSRLKITTAVIVHFFLCSVWINNKSIRQDFENIIYVLHFLLILIESEISLRDGSPAFSFIVFIFWFHWFHKCPKTTWIQYTVHTSPSH